MDEMNESLRLERFIQKVSQVKLGVLTGLGQHTISRIETGKRAAKPREKEKIAKALGVKLSDLWPVEEAQQ